MLGAIGSKALDDVIVFEVSEEKTLTITDFVRENSVRFAENDVLLKKPVSQFVGAALDRISFKIILKAERKDAEYRLMTWAHRMLSEIESRAKDAVRLGVISRQDYESLTGRRYREKLHGGD